MKTYIQKIRAKIGHDCFIHPAARIIIRNSEGKYLFIRRIDNGKLGIPAGGLEDGESIEECIRREVKEETNLDLMGLEVIGIKSHPSSEFVQYPNGDQIQYFTVEFFSEAWAGIPKADQEETSEVIFLDENAVDSLPANEKSTFESLAHYQLTGKILLR